MEERNDAFDSAIREKLSGHEPAVPHALWTRISAELNESEEVVSPVMPQIEAPPSATPWWRVAVAAAVVITIGAASLLSGYQPQTESAVASGIRPNVTTKTSPVIQIQETPQVAVVAAPAVIRKATPPAVAKEISATANTVTADNSADNKANEVVTPAINDNDTELAASTTASASIVDLGNVPAFSLKRLSAPESLNDEITIIKSAPSKKKHGKHSADEETTRVIILNKKFDSQPGIRYQLPVRF